MTKVSLASRENLAPRETKGAQAFQVRVVLGVAFMGKLRELGACVYLLWLRTGLVPRTACPVI